MELSREDLIGKLKERPYTLITLDVDGQERVKRDANEKDINEAVDRSIVGLASSSEEVVCWVRIGPETYSYNRLERTRFLVHELARKKIGDTTNLPPIYSR